MKILHAKGFKKVFLLALILPLLRVSACATTQVAPKVVDCNTFVESYLEIKDIQSNPSEAIEKLESEANLEAWLADEGSARAKELEAISEKLKNISFQDERVIKVRDALVTNFEAATNENKVLLEIFAEYVRAGDDDIKVAGEFVSKNQIQRSKIADVKRQRSDLIRVFNQYCESELPLPYGN